MPEPQRTGMQHDPRNLIPRYRNDSLTPVGSVTEDGMADDVKMRPYLVRATCVWTEHEAGGHLVEPLFDSIVCDRRFRLKRLG